MRHRPVLDRARALACVTLAVALSSSCGEREEPPARPSTAALTVTPIDPALGPADAPVTMVEVFDFACPYCYLAQRVVGQLRDEYGDRLRVAYKYLLIHEDSLPAALAACAAARQGRFEPVAERIWHDAWSTGRVAPQSLSAEHMLAIARDAGLDMQRFRADYDSQACRDWATGGRRQLADLGIEGTPAFVVGDQVLVGLHPPEVLRAAIDERLRAGPGAAGAAPRDAGPTRGAGDAAR